MIRFGVIGYGYWGPNIVRNLRALEGCQVVGICDQTPAARKRIQAANSGIPVHSDALELIQSPDVDAIAVITPGWTHYELTKAALENGKHVLGQKPFTSQAAALENVTQVFVEKPATSKAAQAEELIILAEQRSLQIMVDHTFLFTGAVRRIKKLLGEGAWASLYFT